MTTLYAEPRDITSLDDCLFYHTVELPGHGTVEGMWDLRSNIDKYLGNVDFRGKSVLELGTASGYACFHMESQGADVVAFELAPDEVADLVPYAGVDVEERAEHMGPWLDTIRNSFWFAHKAFNSKARVAYGNAYDVPEELGPVDIAVFGSILLHMRDPFAALHSALRLTRETAVIAEPIWYWSNLIRYVLPGMGENLVFRPDPQQKEPSTTWWMIPPAVIRHFLAVLGFEDTRTVYHLQYQAEAGRRVPYYTVVGQRTVPM